MKCEREECQAESYNGLYDGYCSIDCKQRMRIAQLTTDYQHVLGLYRECKAHDETMEAQNAELLAALKEAVIGYVYEDKRPEWFNQAEKAIASVKGEDV